MLLIDELKSCGTWFHALRDQHDRLNRIDDFLREKETHTTVYPPRGSRLAALRACSLEKVRVLIVAQDPYPGDDKGEPNAMGLALSVKEGVRVPASLKNIYKELSHSLNITPSPNGDLSAWASQGVLLWNVLLTLDAGHPKSHKRSEWPLFTDAVMGVLSEKKSPLVFLSFGRDSHRYAPRFIFPAHKIIKTSHPSPLGAYKHAKDGSFRAFLGSNCFYETNQFLSHNGLHPIHWGN